MDEVSGRGSSSLRRLSDPHCHNQCDECAELGKDVTAAGFCQNCTDFLCRTCIEQHKKARSSRNHNIIGSTGMPKMNPDISVVEECSEHVGRPIEAYCPNDNMFGCALCFTVGHRSCQNVALLSDLSRGVETSKEFLEVQNAADRFMTLEEEYKQAIKECISMNDKWYCETLEGFEKFRLKVLGIVEEIGIKVHQKADTLKEENKNQLTKLSHKISKYTEQVQQYMVSIKGKKDRNQNGQLFIDLKKNSWLVIDSVHRLEAIYTRIAVKKFDFQFDPNIKTMLVKTSKINVETTSLPSLHRTKPEKEMNTSVVLAQSPTTTCKSQSWLNISSNGDHCTCWVTSIMELSETKLILVDSKNGCLKLFDMTSNTITHRQTLTALPWDITKVPECRLAVSFPDANHIQLFKADQTLEPCGSINVPSGCRGLHCTGDKMIVSNIGRANATANVQVLSMTGNVLQVIQYNSSQNELFLNPLYLAVSNDNKLIYVSDYNAHTLTCMTTTGVVQWVYRDQQLEYPEGVTIGEQSIYICSRSSHTIHVVSHDGARLAIIQSDQSGAHYPDAVHYTSSNRTLYVSNYDDDHIIRLGL